MDLYTHSAFASSPTPASVMTRSLARLPMGEAHRPRQRHPGVQRLLAQCGAVAPEPSEVLWRLPRSARLEVAMERTRKPFLVAWCYSVVPVLLSHPQVKSRRGQNGGRVWGVSPNGDPL